MAKKLSRRSIATYVASELISGADTKQLTNQLAAYLVESRRTKELTLLVRDVQYYLAEKGHIVGTIITAHELSASTEKAITAHAKSKTGAAVVKLDAIVDESVLGGFRLNLPGHEIDTTIARQLTTLKTRYKKA